MTQSWPITDKCKREQKSPMFPLAPFDTQLITVVAGTPSTLTDCGAKRTGHLSLVSHLVPRDGVVMDLSILLLSLSWKIVSH